MDCTEIRQRGMADEYRAGRLSPEEIEAYEQHYFSCDHCFEDLRASDRVAELLKAEGEAILVPAGARGEAAFGLWWRRWALVRPAWAAGFAVLLVVPAVFLLWSHGQETIRLKSLVHAEPYPYAAAELRGEPGDDSFRRGMQEYLAGHYQQAVKPLATAAATNLSNADARFYLGVSLLLSSDPRGAASALSGAVTIAPGNDVYRWYFAQALLACGRTREANVQLSKLATSGEMATRATELLRKMAEATGGSLRRR
jgi:hypothetical protein